MSAPAGQDQERARTARRRAARAAAREPEQPLLVVPSLEESISFSSAAGLNQEVDLTARWYGLEIKVQEQIDLVRSPARFKVVPAGRRSGKTEIALRHLVLCALGYCATDDGLFVFAAPTRPQAKKIAWRTLKKLVPRWAMARKPLEGELTIELRTGAQIVVVGMDAPDRIEGVAIDGIVLDEYGNMKEGVWEENIRPALGTYGRPPGWAWFIGVPEGRNHYYKLWKKATRPNALKLGWSGHTWPSWRVMSAEEIANAKATTDPLTFEQEYGAAFVEHAGRAYYRYRQGIHDAERVLYDPRLPLILCFDFNVEPGVCAIVQEQPYFGKRRNVAPSITAVIDEVWIPRHSNTPTVCRKILQKFGRHPGWVTAYGDHTGGRRKSVQDDGLAGDWGQIKAMLGGPSGFGRRFRTRVKSMVYEKDRLRDTNSRLMATDGTVALLVDPVNAPHVCMDYEGVLLLEGGSGEIEKPAGTELTHLTDALGYYIEYRFPVTGPSSPLDSPMARG